MKKFLSLAVMFGALCASVGCDDKKPSTKPPGTPADTGKKAPDTTPPAKP